MGASLITDECLLLPFGWREKGEFEQGLKNVLGHFSRALNFYLRDLQHMLPIAHDL